jgi:release factor glutamine methyltransferase
VHNLGETKSLLSSIFKKADIASFSIDADLIISKITGCTRIDIIASPEKKVSARDFNKIKVLAAKRAERCPMAYMTGNKGFYGLDFKVNKHVLIPRPETEHLIEAFLKHAGSAKKVLDLCCGSGCIGITIKKLNPDSEVHLADTSRKALKVAKNNAKAILKEDWATLKFIKSDLFKNIKSKYDAIISNPPYVSAAEYETLSKDVFFEPEIALIAAEDGLFFYRKISESACNHLNKNALLFLEIGDKQRQNVVDIFCKSGFKLAECIKDLAGKDRVLVFTKI